jgi:hypothetical protein
MTEQALVQALLRNAKLGTHFGRCAGVQTILEMSKAAVSEVASTTYIEDVPTADDRRSKFLQKLLRAVGDDDLGRAWSWTLPAGSWAIRVENSRL